MWVCSVFSRVYDGYAHRQMTKFHILRRFKYLKKDEWRRLEDDQFGFFHDKWDAEKRTSGEFKKRYPLSVLGLKVIVKELI